MSKEIINTSNKKIALSAVIVMSSLIVSRVTGFLREALVVNTFPSKLLTDGYNYAFTITDFFYYLLLGGAIASSLIPVLSGYIAKDREKDGWRGVNTFINLLSIIIVIACFLGMIFSRNILDLWFPKYAMDSSDPEFYRRTVASVISILFPSVACMTVTGFMNGILNSYKRFAAAAYGPTIYNICSCISIFVFGSKSIVYVAYGVLASSFIYMIIQILFTSKHLCNYRPVIDVKCRAFKRLMYLAIPTLLSSGMIQLNTVITKTYTQFFSEGAVTALNNASTLWQLPYGIFAMGIGTAILPSLSEKYAQKKIKEYRRSVRDSLSYILFLIIPSAVAFFALSPEIAGIVFKWSDKVNITLTGQILKYFTLSMIFSSVTYILYRAFFASGNSKIPMMSSAVSVINTAAIGYVMLNFTSMGPESIALTYTISSFISMLFISFCMLKKRGNIGIRYLLTTVMKTAYASLIMIAVILLLRYFFPMEMNDSAFTTSGKLSDIIKMALYIVCGFTTYVLTCRLIGLNEVNRLMSVLKAKIFKMKGK